MATTLTSRVAWSNGSTRACRTPYGRCPASGTMWARSRLWKRPTAYLAADLTDEKRIIRLHAHQQSRLCSLGYELRRRDYILENTRSPRQLRRDRALVRNA